MKYTIATVNETGLAEIKEFLSQSHKKGGDHFTREMLSTWASEAEFQVGEGNPPTIELHARDSVHGRTQEYTISPAGIDTVSIHAPPVRSPATSPTSGCCRSPATNPTAGRPGRGWRGLAECVGPSRWPLRP